MAENTVADNIRAMALLVADVKRQSRLSENTVLRIVDMNLALARETKTFDYPVPNEMIEAEVEEAEVEEAVVAAVEEPTPIGGRLKMKGTGTVENPEEK